MIDDRTPENLPPKGVPWWQIAIPIALIILATIAILVIRPSFFVSVGGYSVEEVVMSADMQDTTPVDIKDVFRPDDTIICTVKTSGVDGIIAMKWYFGDQLVYETMFYTFADFLRVSGNKEGMKLGRQDSG